jgi:hypothetical protein
MVLGASVECPQLYEKNDNHGPDRAPPSDNPQAEARHLLTQNPPAPVDVATFGKRMADIVAAAVQASRKRKKF